MLQNKNLEMQQHLPDTIVIYCRLAINDWIEINQTILVHGRAVTSMLLDVRMSIR